MRGKLQVQVVGALVVALAMSVVAPPGAALVSACALPALPGEALQCATIPGAMYSTFEAECQVCVAEIRLVGAPTGTIAILLGPIPFRCSFELGVGPCNGLGFAWGHNAPVSLTSTIELTNGVGAVVIRWVTQ